MSILEKQSADDPIRAALARDDPVAVELIWDRYVADLLAFLQAVVCSTHDAEDVLQTVFVRIVRKRHRLARARRLDAYVFQMARNEAMSFIRRRQRELTTRPGVGPWLATSEAGKAQSDLVEEMQAALIRLPQSQREVVVLKIYRDKTFREIARLLGLSLNTVASRYRYAMERLRTSLKDSAS